MPIQYRSLQGVTIAVLLVVLLSALAGFSVAKVERSKPNIILILADDMGIDSVSAFNEKLGLRTPAIDRLAEEGMSFTDAHSTSAVWLCSPSS